MGTAYSPSRSLLADNQRQTSLYKDSSAGSPPSTPTCTSILDGPRFWWTLFILSLLTGMLCLCVIVRKQWVEREKLAYPVIQVPLVMTHRESRVFKARILWAGFAIAAGIDTLNGLHFLFPAVPYLHVKLRGIGPLFTEPPWNAIGWTPIRSIPSSSA